MNEQGERGRQPLEHLTPQRHPERLGLPDERTGQAQPHGMSLDGDLLNIRAEGWKEVKVGGGHHIELHLERHPDTAELIQMPPPGGTPPFGSPA